jgi:hypothetical protein
MAYTINIGSRNIKFVSGTNYKVGESLIIAVASSVTFDGDVTGAGVSAMINAGNFTVVSGTINKFSNSPEVVYLNTTSVGFVAQVENNIATLAARDVEIVKRVLHESARVDAQEQQITALETAAAGKAVIDDTSTGTDNVLSASKTLALIGAAKTELQNFASNAASGIIDDTSTGTDKVLSASKITALLAALDTAAANYAAAVKTDLLGGADGAYDTLKEIQTFLQANASVLTALETAGMNKVSFTELQTLSPAQKQTARTNIGAITADEATTIANDRIAAVLGDPATMNLSAIFASLPMPALS